MKKLYLILPLFLAAAAAAFFAGGIAAAPAAVPLMADPTPTPSWFTLQEVNTSATHDGNPGDTLGPIVEVSANDLTGAVITKHKKLCPTGDNNHWAKSRYDKGSGWVTLSTDIQNCGTTNWKWHFQNNQDYDINDIDDLVWSHFPELDGVGASSSTNLTAMDTDYRALTSAGTGGDAGFISELFVWYLIYDNSCDEVVPGERESISTGLLFGTDEVGEVFDLTTGQDYVLYTSGGPWNDGTDDRTDAALRFYDGAAWGEWVPLGEYASEPICDTSFAEEAILFTAEADQTQIQFRVNDTDGNFDDNSGDLEYYWLGGEGGTGQGCEVNWSKDDLVGSVSLDSTSSSYQYLQPDYVTDGLYALTITGTYTDNGETRQDIRIADWPEDATAEHDNWVDYNTWTGTDYCWDDDSPTVNTFYGAARNDFYDYDKTYGFNKAKPLTIVNDDDANYSNNSGSVTVEIHTAGYTAPISDCGTKYEVGTFIESPAIDSRKEQGSKYPQAINGLVPGQVYYLEQVGQGYDRNGQASYDFQMRNQGLADPWTDPEIFSDCVTELDHERYGYYFTAWGESIYIRATNALTATYADNSGFLFFNLYGVIDNTVPDGEDCSDYLSLTTKVWYGDVAADSSPGEAVDFAVFNPGDDYAIKVVSPAYTDPGGTGKTGEIRRAAPGIGSVNYVDFEDWPAGLCYEQDGSGYDTVYFTAEQYSDYEIRATTPDDNSGTLSYEVWSVTREKESDIGCELENYSPEGWYRVDLNDVVNASNATGKLLANTFSPDEGVRYKMETGFISGIVGMPPYWDLEISNDGGSTWEFLSDWADCYVDLTTPEGRFYWTTPVEGGPFLLRVYDAGGLYLDNVGGVQYNVWVDSIDADPGDFGDPYDDQYGYGIGFSQYCTTTCPVPGFLEVGKMIEYARCRVSAWLAWCPEHSKELDRMKDAYYQLEPVALLVDTIGLARAVRDEFDTYEWSDEEQQLPPGTDYGGGYSEDLEISAPANWILMPDAPQPPGAGFPLVDDDASIWGGGEITLRGPDGLSYSTNCDNLLAGVIGNLAGPFCFGANVIDALGLRTWVQFLWDAGMIVVLLYFARKQFKSKAG